MDLTIISTYRCNSKCSTCDIWKHPTLPKDEISLELLKKIPSGIDNLNITGGEPTLRKDLAEIIDILYPKARILEISSNGLYPERLEEIIKKYADIKIRFSLEGKAETSDTIRGEKEGFQKKVEGLKKLKKLGGCDLGFAVTIQDDNVQDLAYLYELTKEMDVELATSALHNGFQFHKNDNYLYERERVAKGVETLIYAMLKTWSVKNWFRAYLNLGLMGKILGNDRLIPCTAGTDFAFVDPWGDVYACNVRNDLVMGNIKTQSWEEIENSEATKEALQKVAECPQNCWMVGSARTAMRHPVFTKLPKLKPFLWVITNKLRVMLGKSIPFEKYVDFETAQKFSSGSKRTSYLNKKDTRKEVHTEKTKHYAKFGEFFNR